MHLGEITGNELLRVIIFIIDLICLLNILMTTH